MKGSTAYKFFLAAFPGYFFYHVLKSSVNTPGVGWFTAVLIICTAAWLLRFLIAVVTSTRISIEPLVTAPFWLMVMFMLATIATNLATNNSDYITLDGSLALVFVTVYMVALFQIGRHIDIKPTFVFTLAMGGITAGFTLCTILFFDPSAGIMVMPLLDGDVYESANYQGMARSVMCTAIVLFPFIKSKAYKFFLMAVTVVNLYLIGSRTELALILITFAVFIFIHFRLIGLMLAILGVVIVPVGMLIIGFDIVDWVSAYVSSDASLNERAVLMASGMASIEKSPLMGDYLGQVREFGAVGSYIHNVMSMWQQFGLFGFAIYVYLIIVSAFIGWECYRKGAINPHAEAFIYLSLVSLVGVLTTKSIFWPLPALAWGLAARFLSARAVAPQVKSTQNIVTSP